MISFSILSEAEGLWICGGKGIDLAPKFCCGDFLVCDDLAQVEALAKCHKVYNRHYHVSTVSVVLESSGREVHEL